MAYVVSAGYPGQFETYWFVSLCGHDDRAQYLHTDAQWRPSTMQIVGGEFWSGYFPTKDAAIAMLRKVRGDDVEFTVYPEEAKSQ